jgi:pimeloyl-ACP methyl ester carboxylesterase
MEVQIETFAGRYCVIRYDLRGIGKTPMVEGFYSHHEDLRGLLDSLKVGRAHLVDCSMGRCGLRLRAPVPGEGQSARTGGVRRERVPRKLRAPWGVGRTGRGRRGGNLGRGSQSSRFKPGSTVPGGVLKTWTGWCGTWSVR